MNRIGSGFVKRRIAITALAAAALATAAIGGPATAGAADGPTAAKSGAVFNYTSTGKLRIGKRISVFFVCVLDCNVNATVTLVAPGRNDTDFLSGGPLAAGSGVELFLKPNGPTLKAMKAKPGKFKIRTKVSASSPTTGQSETITKTFNLKR